MKKVKEKASKPVELPEPPEDSIALRLIVFAMSAVCIGVSCFFVNTSPPAIALYVFLLFSGSYLSYQHRQEKNVWLHRISVIGCLAVGGNFINDLLNPFSSGQLELLTPFVHQVAGTFVCHSFELRSRNDLNFSSTIGLMLMCLSAPVARSLLFGGCVVAYICLGSLMLYFDCLSRTTQMWLAKPISRAVSASRSQKLYSRAAGGNVVLTLCLVPVLTFTLFLFVPRVDYLLDLCLANLQNWSNSQDFSNPLPPVFRNRKPYDFKEHKERLGQAPTDRKDFFQPKDIKDGARLPPRKPTEQKNLPPLKSVSPKDKKAKGKAGKEQKASDKEKPGPQPDQKSHPGKDIKLKPNSKPDMSDDGSDRNAAANLRTPGIGGKKGKAGEKDGKAEKGEQKGDQKAGTDSGKGNGKGNGSGSGASAQRGQQTHRNSFFSENADDSALSANTHDRPTNELMLKVSSNRTCYLKRCSYDTYDGVTWTNSIAADKHLDELKQPVKGPYQLSDLIGLPKRYPGMDVIQDIEVVGKVGKIVPVAVIAQQLGLDTPIITVDSYGVVRAASPLRQKLHYRAVSKIPIYNLKALRRVYPLDPNDEEALRRLQLKYLQLPDAFSPEIATLAATVAGDTNNWFVQSENINKYLQKNFKYELAQPDSTATDTTRDFLYNRKAGDCLDFAGAFVMMTRSVGIPSRLIRGYAPGDFNALTGMREVRVKDAHAWAEIYFGDYGWIPFDATPQGYLPALVKENSYDIGNITKKVEAMSGLKFTPNEKEGQELGPGIHKPKTVWDWIVLTVAGCGSLVISVLVVKALTKMIGRWRAQAKGITPEMKVYREVLQDLKPLKVVRLPADTPDDLKLRFRAVVTERAKIGARVNPQLDPALEAFLDVYCEGYFGSKPRMEELRRLQKEIHRLVKTNAAASGTDTSAVKAGKPPKG